MNFNFVLVKVVCFNVALYLFIICKTFAIFILVINIFFSKEKGFSVSWEVLNKKISCLQEENIQLRTEVCYNC